MRKIISCLLALGMLLALPLAVTAHPVPTGENGTITVVMAYKDKPIPGGVFGLYSVAAVKEEKGDYSFEAVPGFGEFSFGTEELADPELPGKLEKIAMNPLKLQTADAKGNVVFQNVPEGLYLVSQTKAAEGYAPIRPFLISMPYLEGGEYIYQVTANAKSQLEPETQQAPPKVTYGNKLPQTGQLWWPVPVLAGAGICFVLIGMLRRKEDGSEEG